MLEADVVDAWSKTAGWGVGVAATTLLASSPHIFCFLFFVFCFVFFKAFLP